MIWIGDKGRDIYLMWNLLEKDSKYFLVIKKKFKNNRKVKINCVYLRYRFFSRILKEGDVFKKFFIDFRFIVKVWIIGLGWYD